MVKGTVTYQKKPVDYGSVFFFVGTEVKQAEIAPDGTYIAYGVPYGDAKVEVHSRSPKASEAHAHSKSTTKKGPTPPPGPKGVLIPEKYNEKDASGLTVIIQQKIVEFDIELQDPD